MDPVTRQALRERTVTVWLRAELPVLTLSYSDVITGRGYKYVFQTSPTGGAQAQGAITMANARDNLGPPSVWQARTKRCVDNHREGLIMFAPLVLIAAHQGVSTSLTVLGAQLFFWARLAYALIYLAGIPWLRTAAWLVSVLGLLLIFLQLVG